jgi:glycerol-3-phosphate acyltransferase PlsY
VEALGEASSHDFEKTGGGSFGGTELTPARNRRAIIAVLLIDVLKGLGGASQEDQQPALVLGVR